MSNNAPLGPLAVLKADHDEQVARRRRPFTDGHMQRRNVSPTVDVTRRTELDQLADELLKGA